MKKSFVVSIVGLIIVSTVLICNSGSKSYQKTRNFNSVDEIVQILDKEVLSVYDKDYSIKYTNNFLECLSKRKRIVNPAMTYTNLDLTIDEEKNTEVDKNNIISEYLSKASNLKKYSKPEKIQCLSLIGKAEIVEPRYYESTESISHTNKIKLDLVFIDEGEGWVVDYIWVTTIDENNSEGERYDSY